MNGRFSLVGVCLLGAIVAATGCKKGEAAGAEANAAVSAESPAEPEFGPKLNGYVEHCLNVFSSNVFRSEEHYYSWAPKGAPPSEKSKDVKGILSTYIDPKRCVDAVTKSNQLTPHDAALEAAATRYGAALTVMRPVLDDARQYYEARGYKADKFEKAKQLHQSLVKAYDEFDAANHALGERIDVIQDGEDARDLSRIEKSEGRKLPYLVRAAYVKAKATSRLVGKPGGEQDLAEFSKAFAEVDAIVKELLAYRDAHGAEAHEARVQGYTQEAEKFVRFSREFLHKLEDKQPASSEPILDQYNSIVRSYNALRI